MEHFSENHVAGVEPGQKIGLCPFVCMFNEKRKDMMYKSITNKSKTFFVVFFKYYTGAGQPVNNLFITDHLCCYILIINDCCYSVDPIMTLVYVYR